VHVNGTINCIHWP